MSRALIFPGRVTPQGRLQIKDRQGFIDGAREFAGKEIELILRLKKSQRSLNQNAYIHGVPVKILSEHFGYETDEMKLALMGEKWGWKKNELTGHDVPVKPHTSSMTVEEAAEFIDWVVRWAAMNHGIQIPLPNEIAVE